MFYWIYDIPTQQFAVLSAVSFALFSAVGCILIRPFLRIFVRSRTATNDVVGYVLSCFCVIYGILLGLLAVAVYQNHSQVDSNVSNEASSLAAIYYDVSAYPEPDRTELQLRIREYCEFVIKEEWALQKVGTIPRGGVQKVYAFQQRLLKFEPKTSREEIIHAEALHQFNQFVERRRVRLHSVTTGVPAVMWYVVSVGSIVNIVMIWLFDMKFMAHLFLGSLFASFLGTMIFLIAAMDHPFRGEVSVSSEAFQLVLDLITHIS